MRIRLNLHVTKAVADALCRLEDETGAASKTEVVRMALGVYERLVDDDCDGWTTFQRKGDVEREIVLVRAPRGRK